jgi:transcription antitermination factor NusG
MQTGRGRVGGGAAPGPGPPPRALEAGERIRITAGPFEGVEGVVVERRGRRRVLVGLSTIGQGMEVDIDRRMLQPIRLA